MSYIGNQADPGYSSTIVWEENSQGNRSDCPPDWSTFETIIDTVISSQKFMSKKFQNCKGVASPLRVGERCGCLGATVQFAL